MKGKINVGVIVFALSVFAFALVGYRLYVEQRMYGEAEPVALMLQELSRDVSLSNSGGLSRSEVVDAVNSERYQELRKYSIEFFEESDVIVSITVNKQHTVELTVSGRILFHSTSNSWFF